MSETRIVSPYGAIIDGKRTGLAGCGSSDRCERAAYCLRADDSLLHRMVVEPKGCALFISRSSHVPDR